MFLRFAVRMFAFCFIIQLSGFSDGIAKAWETPFIHSVSNDCA